VLSAGALVLDDRFRLIRLLSEGGMGEVYLAEQVSLGRKVALKVLRPELSAKGDMSRRFRREALLLSQVEHPSVVRVIDFGEAEGRPCLVMELVEGQTLQEALEPGPFPVERAVPILVQLADGLAAIHEKGIVHRDLKPDNVVLTRTIHGEQARLLDFGIARLAEPEGEAGGSSVSQAGVILGTPEYLSPEQGFGGRLDARSDLYSLGVLAYRVLSGKLPFVGPTPRQFLAQHVTAAPIPLYQAAPHLVANVPLCELVMQCLRKDPNDRPPSAIALSQALARSVRAPAPEGRAPEQATPSQGRPTLPPAVEPVTVTVPAPAAKVEEPPRRRVGRRARWAAAGGAGLVALGVVVAAALWTRPEVRIRRQIESGDAKGALERINAGELEDTPPARVKALRAAALHRLDRHFDELREARLVDPEELGGLGSLDGLDGFMLEGLAEDYGRTGEPALRRYFNSWPKEAIREPLKALALGTPSHRQWGALRFLDQSKSARGLNLVELYVAALSFDDCGVRAAAARRLAELGSLAALEPLEKLASTPKEAIVFVQKNCGQDEAVAAVKALRKRAGQP
jgi:predicted Ser/Thr protein kinase